MGVYWPDGRIGTPLILLESYYLENEERSLGGGRLICGLDPLLTDRSWRITLSVSKFKSLENEESSSGGGRLICGRGLCEPSNLGDLLSIRNSNL